MSNETPYENPVPEVTPVVEALAVEPETLPTVFAEEPVVIPVVEEPVAVVVEEPAADADLSAAKKTKGKKSGSSAAIPTQLAAGSEVLLSKVVFESKFAKNSASVQAVQTRLLELGHISAGDDRHGWISDGTVLALAEFAADANIEALDVLSEDVIRALFDGTEVVVLP